MKNLTFFIVMLFSITLSAQDYPGTMPELLMGKEVTVLPNEKAKTDGYRNFYTTKGPVDVYARMDKKFTSRYEALVGKTFTVINVEPGATKDDKTWLTLKNNEETVYYGYYSGYSGDYFFEVKGGITFPVEYYKDKVTKSESGSEISYTSNMMQGALLFKTVNGKEVYYAMSIGVFGEQLLDKPNQLVLTFEDGKTLVKKGLKIETSVRSNSYLYKTLFILDKADIELLKTGVIVKSTIHTESDNFSSGKELRGVFNYMLTL